MTPSASALRSGIGELVAREIERAAWRVRAGLRLRPWRPSCDRSRRWRRSRACAAWCSARGRAVACARFEVAAAEARPRRFRPAASGPAGRAAPRRRRPCTRSPTLTTRADDLAGDAEAEIGLGAAPAPRRRSHARRSRLPKGDALDLHRAARSWAAGRCWRRRPRGEQGPDEPREGGGLGHEGRRRHGRS